MLRKVQRIAVKNIYKVAQPVVAGLLRTTERLPADVRQKIEALQMMVVLGSSLGPTEISRLAKHRKQFLTLQNALLMHRYTTVILLAHRIGLFNLLHKQAETPSSAARKLKIHARATLQLLRILEAEGYVERDDRKYLLSPFATEFMAEKSRSSLAPILELMGAQATSFGGIQSGLKDGIVPPELDVFSNQSNYKAFLSAVNSFLDLAGREFLLKYPLPEIRSIILGSMGVSFSALVLDRFPEATVTYGCLDHLVREIPHLRDLYSVPSDRVTGTHAHSGEPDDDRWGTEAYDLIFLTKKMILDPDNNIGEKFATKAHKVLNPGGVALFWESVHNDHSPTALGQALEAALDLGASPIGPVLTRGAMTLMLEKIGFRDIDFVPCLQGSTTFIVARKPA